MALGPVESLVALYLSRRLQLIATRVVSRGTESMTLADPKTIISIGLRFGASAVIIAHNHPSGDVEPSQEDLLMTRSLQSAMHGVGMQLIDHVIVTETGATSLRERGQVR
jgi:DNA repair protein RadC